jgi:comEA protein
MNVLQRLKEYAAFTKNERKIFFFLSILFLAGIAVKVYREKIAADPTPVFDYTASDKEFDDRSRAPTPGNDSMAVPVTGVRGKTAPLQKVNINTAGKSALSSLPGIGPGIAEKIVQYRAEHGRFATAAQLRNVKGIGEKKFEKILPYITIQ